MDTYKNADTPNEEAENPTIADVKKSEIELVKNSSDVVGDVIHEEFSSEDDLEKTDTDEKISFEYTLESNEIFETMQNTYNYQFGKKRITQSIFLILVAIVFVVISIINTANNFRYLIYISLGLLVVIWALPYFYNKRLAKKNLGSRSGVKVSFKKDSIMFFQDEIKNDLLYNSKDPKTNENRLLAIEYENIFVFMYNKRSLFCIPKRVILSSNHEVLEIRDLLISSLDKNFVSKMKI